MHTNVKSFKPGSLLLIFKSIGMIKPIAQDIIPFWTNLLIRYLTLSELPAPCKGCYTKLGHLPIGRGLIGRWPVHMRVCYTVIDND